MCNVLGQTKLMAESSRVNVATLSQVFLVLMMLVHWEVVVPQGLLTQRGSNLNGGVGDDCGSQFCGSVVPVHCARGGVQYHRGACGHG